MTRDNQIESIKSVFGIGIGFLIEQTEYLNIIIFVKLAFLFKYQRLLKKIFITLLFANLN